MVEAEMITEGWEFWHWVASGIVFIPSPLPLSLPPHSIQGRGAWGGTGRSPEEPPAHHMGSHSFCAQCKQLQ